MFYVKANLTPDVEIKIDITDENVFCRCPHCGEEVPVDLSLFATDEDFDINSSAVLCEDCTEEFLMEVCDHE